MQASARVVETFDVPTTGAASVRAGGGADTGAAAGPPPDGAAPPRRLSRRAIEVVGILIGIALVAQVARGHRLSNDEFWSLAAGQWMLAHHAFMGLDPFSYTEAHHRWVTDEWGSEIALASLFRAFGSAAYSIYAIVLGGLCLVTSAAYARALGARGGRVVAIVLVLAIGIAGTVAGDRGLDFSLVWLPLELLLLTKARRDPRWLFLLPLLCLFWVNTHGSILLGLFVLAAELGWSLIPERVVSRIGGVNQSHHTGPLALALLGSVIASCLTPYGPGLLAYDVDVSRNGQIAQYISEWSSPNFHSVITLLVYCVPLAVLVACIWTRRIPLLEASVGAILFVEALQTQRLAVYVLIVGAGLAATLPARAPWGATARRWVGGALAVMAIVIVALPAVPAGSVASDQPVEAFNYLRAHPGRIFTQYTWGDYSVARHRATFVDGRTDLFEGRVLKEFMAVTNLTTKPDPLLSEYHVSYVVWAPRTPLALYLAHDPRWHVVNRSSVALVFARR
ncbi:MAG TPA: hypothetical protein VH012_08225 [Acidimicrobiales bacterium]|nr:hypothetical protein [Acidimicrobiales bacterium]